MEVKVVKVERPEGVNVIIGQAHFIKAVEDLYEALATSCPAARFGLAFCESSGPCLVRVEGNDESLKEAAAKAAMDIGAGHVFVIMLREAYPINVLNAVKSVQEVCTIFCASANPLEVVVAETSQGRGVLGVIDGFKPKGVEGPGDVEQRKALLRKLGYKR
ncbi:MAG: hypothetical protein DRJ69_01880 [Thermoprotei archaeon]|nr:MAG: hypothetical protein DRJ69_01880 [Thermoprotei archaeon]